MHAEQLHDYAHVATELKKLDLPDFVLDIRVSWDYDATGDEALWIWVIVEEGTMAKPGMKERMLELRERIRAAVLKLAPGIWAYIRLDNPH